MPSIIGTLISGAIGGFGKKPKVPELPSITPGQVQLDTIQENLGALPSAEQLSTAVNAVRRREGALALESAAPGARGILDQGTKTISSLLSGEIPEDVVAQIQQNAAQQSFAGGFGGTNLAQGLTARDLGLTSLQLTQQGINSAQQWLAGALQLSQPGGSFDVSGLFTTPQQRLAFEERDRITQFNVDTQRAQVAAAPSPFKAALGRSIDSSFEGLESLFTGAISQRVGGGQTFRQSLKGLF